MAALIAQDQLWAEEDLQISSYNWDSSCFTLPPSHAIACLLAKLQIDWTSTILWLSCKVDNFTSQSLLLLDWGTPYPREIIPDFEKHALSADLYNCSV